MCKCDCKTEEPMGGSTDSSGYSFEDYLVDVADIENIAVPTTFIARRVSNGYVVQVGDDYGDVWGESVAKNPGELMNELYSFTAQPEPRYVACG